MIAGIELGGTKTVVAIGSADGGVTEEFRYQTTAPGETIQRSIDWIAGKGTPEQIGIAAFGPISVKPTAANFGTMLDTPKEGWSGFSILEPLRHAFPAAGLALDTDVNAAAIAEVRLGAARGLEDIAYITIGTGIGAGIVNGGRLVHGSPHPEFGHLKVPHHPQDSFAGRCPFHGDCLEGMACGPAFQDRFGHSAHELAEDHVAWDFEAWYLAHGILALLATVSPQRVIIGGGVSQAAGFHGRVEKRLVEIAGGYFPALEQRPFVVAPELGQQAGICGALLLTQL